MALTKKGIEDTSVIIEIGTFAKFPSTRGLVVIPMAARNTDGTSSFLTPGWRVVTKDLSNPDEFKKHATCQLMDLNLSRSKSVAKISKKDGLTAAQIDAVKSLMRASGYFLDKNNPAEYDMALGEKLGLMSNADYYFEDLRESRVSEESIIEETVAINVALIAMKSDLKTMRDALYLIGITPRADDTASELYFQLIVKLIKEQDAIRRKSFIAFYVEKSVTKEYIEAKLWFNKGLSHGVITTHGAAFMFGQDRLGESEDQCVSFIIAHDSTRRFLINSIGNKSNLSEDVNASRAEFAKNEPADVKAEILDESRGVNYVKDLAKTVGIASNPGPMFSSCRNIEEAVRKFNEKLRAMNIPDPKYISVESVKEQISAKS